MKTRGTLAGKSLALAAVLSLTAALFAAQAAGGDRALDACVSAFIDRYLPDRKVTVRKEPALSGEMMEMTDVIPALEDRAWPSGGFRPQ